MKKSLGFYLFLQISFRYNMLECWFQYRSVCMGYWLACQLLADILIGSSVYSNPFININRPYVYFFRRLEHLVSWSLNLSITKYSHSSNGIKKSDRQKLLVGIHAYTSVSDSAPGLCQAFWEIKISKNMKKHLYLLSLFLLNVMGFIIIERCCNRRPTGH